ncbi:putative serine protease HhoA precursor [Allorhodopirellula heiligendammensis]|uniref:Serine protease HhoA n=2 Tax=Allorhodopirellula heiligendammensis TaxID=2714739 RepID=A0A5C6BDV9_9BACT|nr:putative serine protease HhoA precursor [Allorhodopirellula heiligendammensis]
MLVGRMTSISALALLLGCIVSACAAGEPRLWSDRTGKFSVHAEMVHLENGKVRLRKLDGSVIDVPLDQLSPSDQQHASTNRTVSRSGPGSSNVVASRRGDSGGGQAAANLDQIADSVVMISTSDMTGGSGFGSGFVVGPGLIATNHHVVEQAMKAEVRFRDGTTVKVDGCVAIDEGRDIVILKVKSIPRGVQPLRSSRAPKIILGMPVVAIGHPQGFSHTISRGSVNALRRTEELPATVQRDLQANRNTTWVQTDAVISNGSSGGPILDSDGRVIGIATWIIPGEQLGFAVHVSHLDELQEQASTTKQIVPFPLNSPADHPMLPLEEEVALVINQLSRWMEEVMVRDLDEVSFDEIHPAKEFVPRLVKLAASKPKTRTAFQALYAALQLGASGPEWVAPQVVEVIKQLQRDHFRDKGLKYVAFALIPVDSDVSRDFLKAMVQHGADEDTKSCAALALAIQLKNGSTGTMADDQRQLVSRLLKFAIQSGTTTEIQGESVLNIAKSMHHAIEHLSVGVSPPLLKGQSSEGHSLTLATKPGVASLVLFSASWCGPSERLYPHLRNYLRQYGDEKLQIIGVYGDDMATVKQLRQTGKVTWPSIPEPSSNAIFETWQVNSLPTVYLIDEQGIIRFVSVGYPGQKLDQEVAKLLGPSVAPEPRQEIDSQRPPRTIVMPPRAATAQPRSNQEFNVGLVRNPSPVDLSNAVNCGLAAGNPLVPADHLGGVPRGDVMMAGIPFQITDEYVQLKGKKLREEYPLSVQVPVGRNFDYLFLLDGCKQSQTGGRSTVATVTFIYEDGSKKRQELNYGTHLTDYWVRGKPTDLPKADLAWTGTNDAIQDKPAFTLSLFVTRVVNPYPERKVEEMIYESSYAGLIAPFAVAMTVADYE